MNRSKRGHVVRSHAAKAAGTRKDMVFFSEEIYWHPEDENGCVAAAFRAGTGEYVLITRDLHPTGQERALRFDGVYLEVSEKDRSCYDGVESITVRPRRIAIEVNETGVARLGLRRIDIRYALDPERRAQVATVLHTIFGRLERFRDAAGAPERASWPGDWSQISHRGRGNPETS